MIKASKIWIDTVKEIFSGKKSRGMITIIFVVLTIGSLATSFLGYYSSRRSLRTEISSNELPLTSDNIYSEIQRDILRPVFISSLMAVDTFLRDWAIAGEKDPDQVARYLKEIKERFSTFTSFFVSDKTLNYYYSGGILKKVSPDEPRDLWYFRVRNMKDKYEINLDPDLANRDAMTIFINYKVFGYDGEYIGATGVGLTIEAVKEMIEKYQAKYGRTIYFIDKNGDVKLCGKNFPRDVKNIFEAEGGNVIRDAIKSGFDGSLSYKKSEEIIHFNLRYINEFGWYLIVEQGENIVTRQIFKALLINLLLCSLVALLVLILMFGIFRAYQGGNRSSAWHCPDMFNLQKN